MQVKPYKDSGQEKKQQVEQMFDRIAPKYDFLNHFLSLGIDKLWRRKAVRLLSQYAHETVLDVASGTGDFAVAASRLKPTSIIGFDLSEKMLEVGRAKVQKLRLASLISFVKGDSEQMPFSDNQFDAITVGFGVRNFENLQQGLSEFFRVLKPGGTAVILEFSKPRYFPMKQVYYFYFLKILPWIGRIVSKDLSAYSYLPESVLAFPDGQDFINILSGLGFSDIEEHRLTFGIATIYLAHK
jgi:demethylmenaquinone methyltransferase/2-methoxy-6-polyprenyl-1,4-benzoquinol methylase